jgi:hypothetical protein
MVFERLNTGGVNLQPQEIRVALYHGELVQVLRTLNEGSAWRRLFGRKAKRLKDMELILRFFAFCYHADSYRSPMKDFLNRYMASNRNLSRQSERKLTKVFEDTNATILKALGPNAFRPERAINAAVVDSVMIGVARRLEAGPVRKMEHLSDQYNILLKNRKYREATETGTSQEAKVADRLRLATDAFASVK